MKVRFWGTRGSLAKPGPDTVRYGGNTSCVQVESDAGTLLVIDCGTGAHALGQRLLQERPAPMHGHILISHTHWDHIQGIPFFAPLFVAGNEWDFYAAQGFGESLQETLAGQMEYTYFPITLEALNAQVRYHHLVEGSFQIGDITVHTRYLNHPALTLGFRIEVDGVAVVYACDHEPHAHALAHAEGEVCGEDLDHAEFMRDADLVIHDAQYTAAEYPNKIGWGHSTVEYAMRLCREVGVKRLALTHHDPLRNDDAVDAMMQRLLSGPGAEGMQMQVFAAAEGMTLELRDAEAAPRSVLAAGSALQASDLPAGLNLLVASRNEQRLHALRESVAPDGMEVRAVSDGAAALAALSSRAPSLLIVDDSLPDGDALSLCRRVRDSADRRRRDVPCIVIAGAGAEINDPAVTGYLTEPFSREYARSRIRAWLLRTRMRWQSAPAPASEPQRLAALHALSILDTPREERFDRYTRLASALLGVPVALISLIDAHRQWFKSCVGFDASETSREVSFCAHAILQRDLFVIPDTLLDDRFADNPVVLDGPKVRFYAGCPLFLPDGHCVGTLCLVDSRPRQLSEEQAQLLRDLGGLVEQELLLDQRRAA